MVVEFYSRNFLLAIFFEDQSTIFNSPNSGVIVTFTSSLNDNLLIE